MSRCCPSKKKKIHDNDAIKYQTSNTEDDMDEFIAISSKRVNMFVPISKDIHFDRFMDYLNASTIIHPFSTFRFFWDSFIMIILIFTCFEIPLTLSFQINTSDLHSAYGRFVLFIDLILCTDILFNFRTAFYDKFDNLRLVSNPDKIAKTYLKKWFFIDFITSFPIEFLLPSDVDLGDAPAVLRAFRIIRLVRLFKLVRFFRMLKLVNTFLREFMGPKSALIIRLLRLIASMLLAAHFAACLWYYIGTVHYNDETTDSWLKHQNVNVDNKWDAYLISMYWSIVTLFTTGYGDVIPRNQDEQCVAAVVVLFGTCFFAYLIGAVGSLVAEGDRMRSIREQKFEEAQAFCANKELPPSLSRAIMQHTQYFWKRNFVYDDFEILSSLPSGIQYDVLRFYGKKVFGGFEPFDMLSDTTKGLLAIKLKKISANKGFPLYKHGEPAKEFYIQRTGKSMLIIPTDEDMENYKLPKAESLHETLSHIPIFSNNYSMRNASSLHEKFDDLKNAKRRKLERGDICGHVGFAKGQRIGTLCCSTWCEFYSLSLVDLMDVLSSEYPHKWEKILKKIKKNMKGFKNKLNINLNRAASTRRRSHFHSMFAEDSVQRNDKIIIEHAGGDKDNEEEEEEEENGDNETEIDIQMTDLQSFSCPDDDGDDEGSKNEDDSQSDSGSDSLDSLENKMNAHVNVNVVRLGGKRKNHFTKRKKVGKQGGNGRNNGIGSGRTSNMMEKNRRIMKRKKKMIKEAKSYDDDDGTSKECKEMEDKVEVEKSGKDVKKDKMKNGILELERSKSMPFVIDDDGIDIEVAALAVKALSIHFDDDDNEMEQMSNDYVD